MKHPALPKWVPGLLIAPLLFAAGCSRAPLESTRYSLGTEVRITVEDLAPGFSRREGERAIERAFAEIERIESLAKWGELARLNDISGRGSFPVGGELIGLIEEGYRISAGTRGAFRPDLGPLVNLWGINTPGERVPSQREIDSVLAIVRATRFTVPDSGRARLDPEGAALELGGIAKGYAVDRACEVLRENGVSAGMVWAGGDLRVFGRKRDGTPWRIAVRHPRKLDENLTIIALDSGAVATSGDYERYFEAGGVRYHHIFDPATGYPARASISTTVFAPTCTGADAQATGLFVLGPEEGLAAAREMEVEALIAVEREGEVVARRTPGFQAMEDRAASVERR